MFSKKIKLEFSPTITSFEIHEFLKGLQSKYLTRTWSILEYENQILEFGTFICQYSVSELDLSWIDFQLLSIPGRIKPGKDRWNDECRILSKFLSKLNFDRMINFRSPRVFRISFLSSPSYAKKQIFNLPRNLQRSTFDPFKKKVHQNRSQIYRLIKISHYFDVNSFFHGIPSDLIKVILGLLFW